MILYIVTSTIIICEALLIFTNLLASLVANWKLKTASRIPTLKNELKILLDEQLTINPQETFAKYARVQRKVTKIKDEISKIIKERNYLQVKVKYGMKTFLYSVYLFWSFLILLMYRKETCGTLPENWLHPFGRVLSFPLNKPGVISVPVWMGICRIVSKSLLG